MNRSLRSPRGLERHSRFRDRCILGERSLLSSASSISSNLDLDVDLKDRQRDDLQVEADVKTCRSLDVEDIKKINIPHIILASKDEDADEVAKCKDVLEGGEGKNGVVETYATFHGWSKYSLARC